MYTCVHLRAKRVLFERRTSEGEKEQTVLASFDWEKEMDGKDTRGREATMARNGESETEKRKRIWWLDRERSNRLSGCRERDATKRREDDGERCGGFEWFSCSGTVTEVGRSCSFSWRLACRDHARVHSFVPFVSFRLISPRPVSFSPDRSSDFAAVGVWPNAQFFHWIARFIRHCLSVFTASRMQSFRTWSASAAISPRNTDY